MRLLVPVGEAKKDHAIVTDQTSASSSKSTVNDPKTSGGSFYFLSRSLGLGYTTLTTNIEKEVRSTSNDSLILREKTTLETKFTDVAFGIGENYSLMWALEFCPEESWTHLCFTVIVEQQMKHSSMISLQGIHSSWCSVTTVLVLKHC
jgi:hypothetical protein